MAVLSMLTAAEVLRISDETKRRQVCSTIMAVFDPSHPLVGAPMTVLREAALAKRQGDAVLLNLRQEEDVLPLLDRLREPDSVTAQDQQQLAAWVADQKRGFEAFWKEVSANRDPNLTIDLDFLEHPGLADMIVKSPPAELEMTHDEVRRLFRETAVWGAFGAQVGLSIELAHRHKYSTKKGRLLPGGPDFYQFTYLGLVNEFVTDDQEFLDVAIRGAEMLKRWTGHAVKVSSARSFFNRIGFEHPLRPSTWGRS